MFLRLAGAAWKNTDGNVEFTPVQYLPVNHVQHIRCSPCASLSTFTLLIFIFCAIPFRFILTAWAIKP